MQAKCRATNKAGGPCEGQPIRPSGYCWVHDPQLAAQQAAWRRKGGQSRSNASRARRSLAPAMTSDELLATLSQAIRKVEQGQLEPGPANAMAALARAMNAIRETTEVERRLAELEAAAGLPRRTG